MKVTARNKCYVWAKGLDRALVRAVTPPVTIIIIVIIMVLIIIIIVIDVVLVLVLVTSKTKKVSWY